MVVTHVPTPDPATVERIREAAERGLRITIGGDERAAVRRIVLWVAAIGLVISPWPLAALVPMTLLIATDGLL